MMITRETDYAIRCVIFLADRMDEHSNAGTIAKTMRVPKSFLAKILQTLVQKQVLTSTRGIGGGFRLARKPSSISLMNIIEAMECDTGINTCAIDPRSCALSRACVVHPVWLKIREDVDRRLRRETIQRIINRKR
jgi:Rrf2 family protein